MKKLGALSLVLLLVAGALAAQNEAGTFSITGWSRASYGWDFEAEKHLGKPDGDWDATGIGTTLSYQKGEWTVAGEASLTTEDFGKFYGASGNVKTTWAQGDWTVYGKLETRFNSRIKALKTNEPYVWMRRTFELSVENWKQDVNDWGFKGLAQFRTVNNYDALLNSIGYDWKSDDNKAALFVNFWDKKILLETGFGDYVDDVWKTPGPYELAYESKEDEDSAFRLQFKPFTGLNVGFAWLPAALFGDEIFKENWAKESGKDADKDYVLNPTYAPNAGLSLLVLTDAKPADTLRAITYGAKYSVDPLTVALGFNFQEDKERAYLGGSYKLGDLTFKADTEVIFPEATRAFKLGESVVYSLSPLEIGLTLKEENLVHNVNSAAAKDFQFVISPYVQYDLIDKVARGKLAFEITKGLGDANEDAIKWTLTPSFGWSLKETVALDPDDIGTGFVAKYIYGQEDKGDGTPKTTTNKLYFGFKASF
jgi:hypothetical protein